MIIQLCYHYNRALYGISSSARGSLSICAKAKSSAESREVDDEDDEVDIAGDRSAGIVVEMECGDIISATVFSAREKHVV